MIEVCGDPFDIWCVYSRVRVCICACSRCEPIRSPAYVVKEVARMDRWTIENMASGERQEASLNKVMDHARRILGTKEKARTAVTAAQHNGEYVAETYKYICERGVQ